MDLATPVIVGAAVVVLAAATLSRRRTARTRATWESVTRETIARLRAREDHRTG